MTLWYKLLMVGVILVASTFTAVGFLISADLQLSQIQRDKDFEVIKRVDAQISTIMAQANAAAGPLFVEKQQAVARRCSAAKLPDDCIVDATKGTVQAKPAPPKPNTK